MKHPEEGALGGPVLAGNPITDPMVAGVGRSAPSAAIAPPEATQADRAVEPVGIGPTRNPATAHTTSFDEFVHKRQVLCFGGPLQFNFFGVASASEKILDSC